LRTWGKNRRDAYADSLNAAMHELTQFPALGPTLDGEPAGMRYRPINDHVIHYRIDEDAISIVRILQKRMDIVRQLQGQGSTK